MRKLIVPFLLLLGVVANAQIDTTVLFSLEKLKTINTSYHEGHPVVTSDGKTLYFFVTNHPRNNNGENDSQDIWYSKKSSSGKWSAPSHFDNSLNKRRYNEVLSVVNEGKSLFVTGSKSKNERGLAISNLVKGEWGKLEFLEIDDYSSMNVGRFSGACMTNDMQVIIHYFSETKEGKYSDLYVSFKIGEEPPNSL